MRATIVPRWLAAISQASAGVGALDGIGARTLRARIARLQPPCEEPPIPHTPEPVASRLIYKIADVALWQAALARGQFDGSVHDVRDGFIHFSTAEQTRETAAKHFAGQQDLILAAIDAARLGAALQWERSRGGALFPHLYAPLLLSAVVWTRPLPLGGDGLHVFPQEMV